MQIGVVVRNMGPQSTRETLLACARAVEATTEIADLWVVDHVAIPPDDAEGSDDHKRSEGQEAGLPLVALPDEMVDQLRVNLHTWSDPPDDEPN